MTQIHATCVARALPGKFEGVLLRGDSGAGKSDLALRLIDRGWLLIADDRVDLVTLDGNVMAHGPKALAGRIEVRGVGIQKVPFRDHAPVMLICDLVPLARVPRLPEPSFETLQGIEIPVLPFYPFEASAPEKLDMALDAFENGTLFDHDR